MQCLPRCIENEQERWDYGWLRGEGGLRDAPRPSRAYCRAGHSGQLVFQKQRVGLDLLVDIVQHHKIQYVQIQRYLASDQLTA